MNSISKTVLSVALLTGACAHAQLPHQLEGVMNAAKTNYAAATDKMQAVVQGAREGLANVGTTVAAKVANTRSLLAHQGAVAGSFLAQQKAIALEKAKDLGVFITRHPVELGLAICTGVCLAAYLKLRALRIQKQHNRMSQQ